MTVKFIPPEEVLPLRSLVLRNGMSYEFCRFDEDDRPETIHLGVIDDSDDLPKCVLTAFPSTRDGFNGVGYQLRGMATHPAFQGMGLGAKLVDFLINYLRRQGVAYIWCNAREVAFPFYEKLGFTFISEEFSVENIGLHRAMHLLISV